MKKDQVARDLAHAHYQVDAGIREIYRLLAADDRETDEREPVKLLEVNDDTVPAGVRPLYFGAHPASGVLYPSVVVVITPEEYPQAVQELRERYGWEVGLPYGRPNGAEHAQGA